MEVPPQVWEDIIQFKNYRSHTKTRCIKMSREDKKFLTRMFTLWFSKLSEYLRRSLHFNDILYIWPGSWLDSDLFEIEYEILLDDVSVVRQKLPEVYYIDISHTYADMSKTTNDEYGPRKRFTLVPQLFDYIEEIVKAI